MWKRGGRSSALDRAQALLSAKRGSRGDGQGSTQDITTKTQGSVGGSIKTRSAPPTTHTLFSDLSDLSSVASDPEGGADAEMEHGKKVDSHMDLRPQSSLGGGSRFLKKAPLPTNSSHSPVSRNQMQQVPESRSVSSSQRGSQTAALSRLAEIESRIRSRKQVQEQARQGMKPALNVASDSPPPAAATQSLEAPVQHSAQSSSDQSLRGNRFLKNKAAGAVEGSNVATAVAPTRSKSRAANPVVPSDGLETKSLKVTSGVSLESDEEDMRKLLGDSMDSTDSDFLKLGRPSSMKKMDMTLSKGRIHPTPPPPPPAAAPASSPSNRAPPRSPASPSRRSSPFRFTGQAQAHFSPSVLSPSPSPPLERLGSSYRVESPQRSLSSMSGPGDVHSLEELFPVGPGSEDPHSEMSSVSSEDFKLNVRTLDDLVPATLEMTRETAAEERETKHGALVLGSPDSHQQQEEEEVVNYQSDFESESRTEPDFSAGQVSEHLHRDGDEEEVLSEVREELSHSDMSRGRTDDDYSSAFSDTSRSCASRTSDGSQTSKSLSRSRSRDSRSSGSGGTRTSSQQSRRRVSGRRVVREAAVQTQPDPLASTWSPGMTALGPAVGMTYLNPPPMITHTLSAEVVEAISTFSPTVFALNEILKQRLAMTTQFMESSQRLYSSLLQSLEPPNYRYTTLQDTKQYIHKHRSSKVTVEVLQERRDST